MNNPGKVVVVAIFGLALLMTGLAWYWNYLRTKGPLEFWGAEGALLIRRADQVRLFQIQPQSDPQPSNLQVLKEADISKALGLVNARQPLQDDGTYQWNAAIPEKPTYTHGVEFRRDGKEQTVLFDFDNRLVRNLRTGKSAGVVPKIATGWRDYASKHLASAGKAVSEQPSNATSSPAAATP